MLGRVRMPRAARIVLPDCPHHIIQRGNHKQDIFFSDEDCRCYIDLLAKACVKHQVRCLAWCLMSNHIHLILIPATADALRALMASVHTTYSQRVNRAQSFAGHLFQGRFASYPMDEAHLLVAVRYVENNPVKAGLVAAAEEWRWSSAAAHVNRRDDGLTDLAVFQDLAPNWRAMLAEGWEASERDELVETSLRSGLPLGKTEWLNALGSTLGLSVVPGKRGPKPKAPPI